jgi:hypothetical protein
MQNFYAGSLKLHDLSAPNDFWLKSPVLGLDTPEYRLSINEKAGEDGGNASSAFYGPRLVTLEGYIRGGSVALYEENRRAFASAFAINREANGTPVLTRFEFTTLSGAQYYFYGIPRRPVFSQTNIDYCDFMVSIVVPQPQLFSVDEVSSGQVLLPEPTGITFPLTFPITFGGVLGGTYAANNPGTMLSWPVITLRDSLTSPYILNATTGQVMQLNYTLLNGDVVEINMLDKTIVLNGSANLLSTKSLDSEWWAMQPGNNVIIFASGGGSDTGTLEVTFNPAYVGV